MRSVILSYSTTKRLVKWVFGRAESQVESEPGDRSKDYSSIGNLSRGFKQCKKPITHAGRSIERSRKRVQDEWDAFRDWWKNTTSVSNRSILIDSMRAAEIKKTADEQLRAFHGDVGEKGVKSDYEMN